MFTMLGLRTTDETYEEHEELSRPKWPLPTSWAQAGQAGAKTMNPVVAFSLSKQPFSEGSSEYPVGYVSLLGARWALRSKPQELSCWFSFLPQRDLLLSWHRPSCPFPHCMVAMDTAGSASVPGEPGFASPSLGRWMGVGWLSEGAGPVFLSEVPFRFQLSIPRATLSGSWGWPVGQKGR